MKRIISNMDNEKCEELDLRASSKIKMSMVKNIIVKCVLMEFLLSWKEGAIASGLTHGHWLTLT